MIEASPALPASIGRPRPVLRVRRNVAIGLALGMPISGALLYLATRNLEPAAVFGAIRSARLEYLAPAVITIMTIYGIQAYRWWWISRHHARLPRRTFVGYVLAGIACNNVVPGRPGDVLRAHWLAGASAIPRARALSTVVVDRGSDVLALVILLAVGVPVAYRSPWLRQLELAAVVVALIVVAVLLAARRYHRRAGLRVKGSSRAARLLWHAHELFAGVGRAVNRRDALVVGALSLFSWATWAAAAWFVARSLGIELGVFDVLLLTAVVNLGVAIPSSPGFVGTYQWLCVTALGLMAVTRVDALAFSVLMQAVWFVPTTVAGVVIIGRRAVLAGSMKSPAG